MGEEAKKGHAVYVKHMVCNRCISAVAGMLNEEGIGYNTVALGEILLQQPLSLEQQASLGSRLSAAGFQLLDNDRSRIIEQIKTLIIQRVHYEQGDNQYNLSLVISQALKKDYAVLSRLFSEVEGITIEKYAINQKIERVKELIAYGEMNLSEIAFQLGYSSVAHLSAQFKKVTGLTASTFKSHRKIPRKPIDHI